MNLSVTPLLSQLVAVTTTLTAVTSTWPCTWSAAGSAGACAKTAGTTPRGSTAITAGPFTTGTPSRPSRIPTRAFVSPQPLDASFPMVWEMLKEQVSLGYQSPLACLLDCLLGLAASPNSSLRGGWGLQNHFDNESVSFSEQIGPDNPGPSWQPCCRGSSWKLRKLL